MQGLITLEARFTASDARFRVHLDSGSDSDSRINQKSDSGSDSDSSKKLTDSIPIPIPTLNPWFRFRFQPVHTMVSLCLT